MAGLACIQWLAVAKIPWYIIVGASGTVAKRSDQSPRFKACLDQRNVAGVIRVWKFHFAIMFANGFFMTCSFTVTGTGLWIFVSSWVSQSHSCCAIFGFDKLQLVVAAYCTW